MQILVNINDDGSITACRVQGQIASQATSLSTAGNLETDSSLNAGASPFAAQQNMAATGIQQTMNIDVTPGFNGGARLQTIN